MSKQNFEATEGLLHDVMRKQSGRIEKSWLEALMNSVDANADTVEFNIGPDSTTIRDDGTSMTEEEIDEYFKQFGYKDSDIENKEFGKFRMGRGQIFNFGTNVWRCQDHYLIVDLENDETTVELPDCQVEEDDAIVTCEGDEYVVSTEGLSYVMLPASHNDSGLTIEVQHYDSDGDVDAAVREFKELARYVPWVYQVDITVNGSLLSPDVEVIDETELAWYVEEGSDFTENCPVYNLGAKVSGFQIAPLDMGVVTKEDLDVTLDRTDILEHDETWQAIQNEAQTVAQEVLLSRDSLSPFESKWLLGRAADDLMLADQLQNVPVVEDVSGESWTLDDLGRKTISFSESGNDVAEDAMRDEDVVVLDEEYESTVNDLASSAVDHMTEDQLKRFEEVVETEMEFEMIEQDMSELGKRQQKKFRQICRALDDLGIIKDVRPGYSNHRDVWQDGGGIVYINKSFLDAKKNQLATEVLIEVLRHAVVDQDTRTWLEESFSTKSRFYDIMHDKDIQTNTSVAEVQQRMLRGDYK